MDVACKEIEDSLAFRSAACMQTTVIAQKNKTAFSKKKSSPVTQKSPEKVSTHNIFPIVPVFLLYYGLALQTSSTFSMRSERVSISVRFSFAFCCYLSHHLGTLPKIQGDPPTFFFSPVLPSFMVSSSAQDLRTTRNNISPQRLGFSVFMCCSRVKISSMIW